MRIIGGTFKGKKISEAFDKNTRPLKDLVKEFLEKHKELKEFEEEMEKHKIDITPGQLGDAKKRLTYILKLLYIIYIYMGM